MRLFYWKDEDGRVLPERKSGRGYTWSEPERKATPRFHHTPIGAKKALKWWMKGPIDPTKNNGKATPAPHRHAINWKLEEVHV